MGIVSTGGFRGNQILRPLFRGIPQQLKARRGWAGWRAVERDGRTRKVPVDPNTGRYASVTDRGTWGTYQQAVNAYDRGGLDGIGLLLGYEAEGPGFLLGKPLTGFDFDNCVDPRTQQIDPAVQLLLRALNSYSEISPSGRGIKAFAFGALAAGPCRRGGAEIYGSGRYFTVTGWRAEGCPRDVEDRGPVVTLLQAHLLGVRP